MTYVGGLRARLIHDSIFYAIEAALTDLDWFVEDRQHAPVSFLPEGVADFDNIAKNTATLTSLDVDEFEEEMGSRLTENRWTFYVDFYAENEAIGTHFITDIKDIVGGRMPSVDREYAHFEVLDYTQATPTHLFYVQVEDVSLDRPTVYERPWQRYMRVCRFDILDYYGTEDDS